PDPLAVLDSGRDADVQPAGLGHPAGAPALRALLLHDRADSLAVPARLGEAERPLVAADQPGAAADRAGARGGAGFGAAALAGVAHAGCAQRQRQAGAVHRVREVDGDLGLHIAAPGRLGALGTPTAEDRAEQVGEAGGAEPAVAGPAEQVRDVEGRLLRP